MPKIPLRERLSRLGRLFRRSRPLTFEEQLHQRIGSKVQTVVQPLISNWQEIPLEKRELAVKGLYGELFQSMTTAKGYNEHYTTLANFCFYVFADVGISEESKKLTAKLLSTILTKENPNPAKALLVQNLTTIRRLPSPIRQILAKGLDLATKHAIGLY